MHTRTKLALTTLTASLLMSLAVSSATAGRLSTTNTRFRITWNELRFVEVGGGTGLQMTCRLTLEGSFHSATIRKTPGALAGAVTRGIIDSNNCRGALEPHRASVLQETLPWHLTYESFSGTLPNITSLTFLLTRYAYQVSATYLGATITCLYADGGLPEENQAGEIARNTATGALTTHTIISGRRSRFIRGSGACPPFGTSSATGQVFLLGNTTRISITLI
jgi:hypothetical protein